VTFERFHAVGCEPFPDFVEPVGEMPVNPYNRPYHTDYCSDLPVRADPGVGAIRK
jgi:hypothetical protein